jgi:hypothetical protein
MLQNVVRKIFLVLMLFALAMCIQLMLKPISTQANDESRNMRILLERLKLQTEMGTDLTVTFQFLTPLTQDGAIWWSFPYSNEDPNMQRSLGEIGDDYLCFDELAGQGFTSRCTPFSNIVTVAYSEY